MVALVAKSPWWAQKSFHRKINERETKKFRKFFQKNSVDAPTKRFLKKLFQK